MNELSLQHGDCLELLGDVPDKSVHLICCDLPYGVTRCSWDSVIPLDGLWKQYKRVLSVKGTVVLTARQPFTTELICSNKKWFRYELIWEKSRATGFLDCHREPLRAHENVLVFAPRSGTYNPQWTPGDPVIVRHVRGGRGGHIYHPSLKNTDYINESGDRYPRSVLRFPSEGGLHPTQKPLALMEWIIKTYSNGGETVLDNCMGSGTTGVACMIADRRFIGMERDIGYFEQAKRRIHAQRRRSFDIFAASRDCLGVAV